MSLRYHDQLGGFFPVATADTGVTNLKLGASQYYVIPGSAFSMNARVDNLGAFNNNKCIYYFGAAQNFQTDNCEVVRTLSDDLSVGIQGLRFYIGPQNSVFNSKPFIAFYDLSGGLNRLITVACEAFGVVAVYRGHSAASGFFAAGTLLGKTRPGIWNQDEWFFLEVKVFFDTVSGSVQVRLNTEVVLDIDPVNTGGTLFNGHGWGSEGFAGNFSLQKVDFRIQDLYVCDDQGSVNNNYLGNVRVKTQVMVGPGPLSQFSRVGAATNWQAASNQDIDNTRYVYDTVVGHRDLYAVDPIVNSPVVYGVQLRAAYEMDDATQRIARNTLQTAGVDSEGIDHYLNQSFTYYTDMFELNPNTGVGWTGAEVNALYVGPKVEG